MNPLTYIKKLLQPPKKERFKEGQRIKVECDTGANYGEIIPNGVCYYEPHQYTTIRTDMRLIYHGEDNDKVYFRCRSNFIPQGTEAYDNSIVYFDKDRFENKLDYKLIEKNVEL